MHLVSDAAQFFHIDHGIATQFGFSNACIHLLMIAATVWLDHCSALVHFIGVRFIRQLWVNAKLITRCNHARFHIAIVSAFQLFHGYRINTKIAQMNIKLSVNGLVFRLFWRAKERERTYLAKSVHESGLHRSPAERLSIHLLIHFPYNCLPLFPKRLLAQFYLFDSCSSLNLIVFQWRTNSISDSRAIPKWSTASWAFSRCLYKYQTKIKSTHCTLFSIRRHEPVGDSKTAFLLSFKLCMTFSIYSRCTWYGSNGNFTEIPFISIAGIFWNLCLTNKTKKTTMLIFETETGMKNQPQMCPIMFSRILKGNIHVNAHKRWIQHPNFELGVASLDNGTLDSQHIYS